MSDQWGPTSDDDSTQRDDTAWSRPDGPPTSPSPFEPVQPPLTLDTEQAVSSGGGGGRGRIMAALLGVLVLLGGTVFAATQLGSSGPSSGEEAVRELLQAASDEDLLGVMASLDPGERDALRQPVEDLFGELERLEVFESLDLGAVAGIDLEFEGVELRSEPVRDDLVRVYFTGGTVTAGVDGDELPLGDFVRDTVERFEADLSGLDESETSPIAGDDVFLVARNGDDGWRVSIGYTIAEHGRLDAGLPLQASGLDPIGSGSPEEAVESLLRSMAELDLGGSIARLSPGEMAALQDYAPLFLDDAQQAIDAESAELDVTIDDLALRSDTDGDRATVFVDRFAITATFEGESVSVGLDEGCITVSGPLVDDDLDGTPFADGPVCTDELTDAYQDMVADAGFDAEGMDLPEFPPMEMPELGITTVRIDGEWYVAPIGTYLDGAVEVLRVFERAHLDAFVQGAEQFFFYGFGFGGGYEETFEEVGESIEGGSFEEGYLEEFEEFQELEEFEELEELEVEPGTAPGVVDEWSVHALASEMAGGEPEATKCVESELWQLDERLLYEIVDSWEYQYDPGPEAQDAVVTVMERCGLA